MTIRERIHHFAADESSSCCGSFVASESAQESESVGQEGQKMEDVADSYSETAPVALSCAAGPASAAHLSSRTPQDTICETATVARLADGEVWVAVAVDMGSSLPRYMSLSNRKKTYKGTSKIP